MAGCAVRISSGLGLGIQNLSLDCLTNAHGVPIFLVSFTRIILGRASTNSIFIDSANVSRTHAIIQKIDNQWQIKDANSTNGVFINDLQITPDVFYKLVKGDVISLGPPASSSFKFTLNNYNAASLPSTYFKVPCHIFPNGMVDATASSEFEEQNQVEVLRTYAEEYENLMRMKNVPKTLQDENAFLQSEVAKLQAKLALNVADELEKYQLQAKLNELKDVLAQKEQIEIERNKVVADNEELQRQLGEANLKHKALMEFNDYLEQEVHGFKQTIKDLLTKNERLQREKMEIELRAKHQTAEALNSQIELQKHFSFEKDLLIRDKMLIEKNLLLQIEDFQKKLDNSDRQNDILRSELFAINMENEQALCNAHRQISDIMEAEMVCSICSELFFNSATLGCTHSFCNDCISEWRQGQRSCPICRTNIVTITRCPVLDNFIESMVLNFNPDEIEHRETVRRARIDRAAT